MARRRPNHRLVKIHRSYSIEEVARLLLVHKNSVRAWLKQGLPATDARRPTLIHGRDLVDFLVRRRAAAKRPCAPGEIYCVGCRRPQVPAGGMVDYLPLTETSGNLRGICPECEALMFRRLRLADLDRVTAGLDVQIAAPRPRLRGTGSASVDCDSGRGAIDG